MLPERIAAACDQHLARGSQAQCKVPSAAYVPDIAPFRSIGTSVGQLPGTQHTSTDQQGGGVRRRAGNHIHPTPVRDACADTVRVPPGKVYGTVARQSQKVVTATAHRQDILPCRRLLLPVCVTAGEQHPPSGSNGGGILVAAGKDTLPCADALLQKIQFLPVCRLSCRYEG